MLTNLDMTSKKQICLFTTKDFFSRFFLENIFAMFDVGSKVRNINGLSELNKVELP
jgi:hypothetical protein